MNPFRREPVTIAACPYCGWTHGIDLKDVTVAGYNSHGVGVHVTGKLRSCAACTGHYTVTAAGVVALRPSRAKAPNLEPHPRAPNGAPTLTPTMDDDIRELTRP